MRQIDADAIPYKRDIAVTERFPKFGGFNGKIVYSVTKEEIDAMPTIDAVTVRHGRWIDIDSETYTWKIQCSKCGHERSMMSTGQMYPMYCENCGARMDGKDDDGMAEFDKGIISEDQEVIVKHILYTDGTINTVTIGKLVRCKNCTEYQQNFYWCKLHDGKMQPTDFCSYGERKDGDYAEGIIQKERS